jgi:acetyl-CoA C-acetyltransferase
MGARETRGASEAVVILGAARTPIGAFLGAFKNLPAPELGGQAIAAAVSRAAIPIDEIDECVMGCVLTAGLGQAPARQAALRGGLSESTGCVTLNKMCGSGMKAIMDAHDRLRASSASVIVAGGMESMSNAPYLLDRARSGFRMGHKQAIDHMLFDGLEDAYEKGRLMGSFAEDCATEFQFTRTMQDEFALSSLERARRASFEKLFEDEIALLRPDAATGAPMISQDELPLKADAGSIPKLRPVFREGGTVTAANSSGISDGAAALVLSTLRRADLHGRKPLATVAGHVNYAGPPNEFPTAPVPAIRKLMDKVGWRLEEVDLFEINEAFAVVTMAAMRRLGLPRYKVNVHGGACALGHPIGASGARIVATLLSAMKRYDLVKGVAALCIGGGEATAIAVERIR